MPKKKLVPQVEIPGSYGQLQNRNLEISCCGWDLSMSHWLEQLVRTAACGWYCTYGCNWLL